MQVTYRILDVPLGRDGTSFVTRFDWPDEVPIPVKGDVVQVTDMTHHADMQVICTVLQRILQPLAEQDQVILNLEWAEGTPIPAPDRDQLLAWGYHEHHMRGV